MREFAHVQTYARTNVRERTQERALASPCRHVPRAYARTGHESTNSTFETSCEVVSSHSAKELSLFLGPFARMVTTFCSSATTEPTSPRFTPPSIHACLSVFTTRTGSSAVSSILAHESASLAHMEMGRDRCVPLIPTCKPDTLATDKAATVHAIVIVIGRQVVIAARLIVRFLTHLGATPTVPVATRIFDTAQNYSAL